MYQSDRQIKRWICDNATSTLDCLSKSDARMWHALAERDTWNFLRLCAHAFRYRRNLLQLPPPASKLEMKAFQIEFRVKIQLIVDGFDELPAVPLFEICGAPLYESRAFKMFRLMYGKKGGRV